VLGACFESRGAHRGCALCASARFGASG
jgi:hypothetical protein